MRKIRFRYRKVIDVHAKDTWSRMVWEDSYAEFKMQFQLYNQDGNYFSFGHLLANNPKAEQLHFLVGGSVMGYVEKLNGRFPDIVDNIGLRVLRIGQCRFEVINSDIRNKEVHQIAINFYSPEMLLHETVGNHLLVSELSNDADITETHLISIVPFLTIDQIQYGNQ